MVEAEAKRSVRERVKHCVERHVCLRCAQDGREVPAERRGLCQLHFSQWYGHARRLSGEERVVYEAESIREGLLLPTRQGQRVSAPPNPYREIAERVRRGGVG